MSLSLEVIKSLDLGGLYLYVLELPFEEAGLSNFKHAVAIPVLRRKNGLLLALPVDFFPSPVLEAGAIADGEEMIGPSKMISVPAMVEEADGTETETGTALDLLLVDCDQSIVLFMRELDPVTDSTGIQFFSEESMDVLPQSQPLLAMSYEWLQSAQEARVQFYSAVEEDPFPEAAQTPKQPAKKPAPKRVTTAALAEQLAEVVKVIPALSSQLELVRQEQLRMGGLLAVSEPAARVPAIRQPFQTPPMPSRAERAQFLKDVGPPPRAKTPGAVPPTLPTSAHLPGEEPNLLPSEEGYMEELQKSKPPQVADILMQQSSALTALVAHLASQDGFGDLGGSASSSSGISLKGSAKRDKLLQDLALRKGDFMLKVAQNAYKRIKPTEKVPASLAEFRTMPVFAKYMERQGGFSQSRDMGLVMWLLAQVADQMLQGDAAGAQELLALAMVTSEQVAQDRGRWDVAWILSLQEDPPPGVFQHRPASTNPRLKAFSPLCPPEWAATALAYVKEVDLLSTRRQEALPKKPGAKPDEPAAPKKPPRYAKKPKQAESASEQG